MSKLTVIHGNCVAELAKLPAESVQCCVTSPPYWGLRDYGTAKWEGGDAACDHLMPMPGGFASSGLGNYENGLTETAIANKVKDRRQQFKDVCGKCGAVRIDAQIGLENTPELFVATMVQVFREVHRILKPDGTCWINLGDSYANVGKWGGSSGGKHVNALHGDTGIGRTKRDYGDLKQKDLVGIPWMVAFALRADGWYLRSDIIWSKPNPMPESVTDRPTKAHEYIFLLTKSQRYFYDAAAIAEPLAYGSIGRLSQDVEGQEGGDRVPGKTNGKMKAVYKKPYTNGSTKDYAASGAQDASATKTRIVDRILAGEIVTRNKRSVWTVTTKPFKGAHFATYPTDLIEPCILAGSRAGDMVLDPFGGSGTTGKVALGLGRDCTLIELNADYLPLIAQRTNTTDEELGLPHSES